MEKEHFNKKVLSTLLAVLLVSSAILVLASTSMATVKADNSYNNLPATGYGDPKQENYSYPVGPGGNSGNNFYNAGPAPDSPTQKWMVTGGSGTLGTSSYVPGTIPIVGTLSGAPMVAMAGKIICYTGTNQPGQVGTNSSANAVTGAITVQATPNVTATPNQLGNFTSGAAGALIALDPQDGHLIWNNTLFGAPRGFGTNTFFQVDATHVGEETGSGVEIYSLIDGSRTGYISYSSLNTTNTGGFTAFGGGSVVYWGGFYSSWDQMKYSTAAAQPSLNYTDPATGLYISTVVHIATAINCSDPTNPYLQWTYVMPTGIESLGAAPGIGFFGGYGEGQVWAINASTGHLIWTQFKVGNAGYIGNYYEGLFYQSASSTLLTAWNATTGELVFQHDEGGRAYFVFGDSLAYGMYIGKNIALPNSYVGAWDAQTGTPIWKTPALYNIAYLTPVVADGKVYVERYSGTAGGEATQGTAFACFDAFTGAILWQLNGYSWSTPIVAYGNLYVIQGGQVLCIGDASSAGSAGYAPQSFNELHPSTDPINFGGVIQGQTAPNTLTLLFKTAKTGPVTGSCVAADGKIFYGSLDQNMYCADANTGALIWNTTLGYRISSTPAVYGGKVFTGADDGYVYALDENTGAKLWTTPINATLKSVFWVSAWQPRSSPQVDPASGNLYVGALDGNLYCLNMASGSVVWKNLAGNATYPIGGTPLVVNQTVYVASSNSYVYAFNKMTGAPLWNVQVQGQTGFAIRSQISTPTYDRGAIWVACSTFFVDRINATTGEIMNSIILPYSAPSGTMTPAITAPAVWHSGSTYTLFVGDGFQEDAFDVSTFRYGAFNGTGTHLILNASYTTGRAGVYYNDTTLNTVNATNPSQILIRGYRIVAMNSTLANIVNINYSSAVVNPNNNVVTGQPSTGPRAVNETNAPLLWARWLGHQIYASSIYFNDFQGPKLYLGDDVDSITIVNATTPSLVTGAFPQLTGSVANPAVAGNAIQAYVTGGPVFSSACVYNDTLYMGTQDGVINAFRDPQVVSPMTISAQASKTVTMWTDENLTIAGKLQPSTTLDYNTGLGIYPTARLANTSVTVVIVLPDNTNELINTTTDNGGNFIVNYVPTTTGSYNWLAEYTGQDKGYILYPQAFTTYTNINVTLNPNTESPAPTETPSASPSPSESASPSATIAPTETPVASPTPVANNPDYTVYYVLIVVIVIIVIALGAYMYMRRGKKA